ncbi:MAG: peptide deformylase [Gammaproteobacteria bacterium]
MIRDILRMGDPRLLAVSAPVADPTAPEIAALVADLFDTMHAANGAGLAAPQIGVGLRVVIFGYRDASARNPRYPDADPVPETILVNPELTPLADEFEDGWEGCLSVPGLRGVVPRHTRLRYRGFDLAGRLIEREVEGFHARVVQHECDHLDGILYPMRIRDFSRFGFTDILFPGLDASADD